MSEVLGNIKCMFGNLRAERREMKAQESLGGIFYSSQPL